MLSILTRALALLSSTSFSSTLGVSAPSAEKRVDPTASLEGREDYAPARVPYVFPAPGTNPIADAIRARRENGTLLALDGVLLNSPFIAQGWNDLFGVVRGNTSLPGDLRELVILRIATLNNASYEWLQHEAVGRAEGLTTAQLQAIRSTPSLAQAETSSLEVLRAETRETLGSQLAAALEFTDWNTQAIRVPKEIFEMTREALGGDNKQIVELAATCGGYNFVSRFLVSLDIEHKEGVPVPTPK